ANFCNVCSHEWSPGTESARFRSIDELVRVTNIRRDEVAVLAEIGALNSLGYDRRSAMWQIERAVRPSGVLFEKLEESFAESRKLKAESPLPDMNISERLI